MKKDKFPRVPECPGRRLEAGFAAVGHDEFYAELLAIGRAIGGPEISEQAAYTLAVSGTCHCGYCRGYAHCKYRAPRHIGDVLSNVFSTGKKSGALVANASRAYDDHKSDDVILDLGMGAGTCTAGWDLERGEIPIGIRLGVDIETEALRLAHAVHPNLQSAASISELTIPDDGHLIVLTGLVFNEVSVEISKSWADAISIARDSFTWIDVSYQPNRSSRPDVYLAQLGYKQVKVFDQETSSFTGNGGYVCEATTWHR
jgi:hypothetical protein